MKFDTETMPKLPTNIASGKAIIFDGINDYKNAVKAVQEEYKALLCGGSCGVANFEATYEEAMTKLHEAGLDAQIEMVREALANLK